MARGQKKIEVSEEEKRVREEGKTGEKEDGRENRAEAAIDFFYANTVPAF